MWWGPREILHCLCHGRPNTLGWVPAGYHCTDLRRFRNANLILARFSNQRLRVFEADKLPYCAVSIPDHCKLCLDLGSHANTLQSCNTDSAVTC